MDINVLDKVFRVKLNDTFVRNGTERLDTTFEFPISLNRLKQNSISETRLS